VKRLLKILNSKKGISPILATLLLIVISVAAVIITYAWVLTFTGTQTGQAGVFLKEENISWPSGQIQIIIRNTGTSNGKITAAYIGTSSSNLTSATVASPSLPANINADSTVTITLTYSWSSGTRYYFKIATDSPASLEFSAEAP
jgi:flagellin-like protein